VDEQAVVIGNVAAGAALPNEHLRVAERGAEAGAGERETVGNTLAAVVARVGIDR
jgi:hypothetical protein